MADDESWRLPKSVQQLVASVQEPPKQYFLREQERLCGHLVGTKMPEPVPTIDIGLLSASDDAEEATKLRSVLQTWGFFQVSNHGIETSLMDSVMAASREFFRLPLEDKKKHSNIIGGKHFQLEGYGNDQVKTQDQTLDWSDRLHLRVEPEDERNFALWPTHPTSFRDDLHEYTIKSRRVKDNILRAIAKLLELDEDCLINQFSDKAPTYARFNYYPPCPRPDLVLGIRPHSDVTVLTVLLMDKDVAGLQVLRDGTWYNLPTSRNHTLLINIGVILEVPIYETSSREGYGHDQKTPVENIGSTELNIDEDYLRNQFGDKCETKARINYCPPRLSQDLVFSFRPHSDAGTLTILLADKDVGRRASGS